MLYYSDFKENASDTLLARVHGNDESIQVTLNCLKIDHIGFNEYAIYEFLCMSTTRCKFISIIQDRHMLSSTFPKGILRHIRIGSCVPINLPSNLEVNFLVFQAPIHIY